MPAATAEVHSIYETDRDPAPFIPFIQAVGRGEKLKRDLTYEESVECPAPDRRADLLCGAGRRLPGNPAGERRGRR